jgi:2-polyprenyl-3-methyl-5-hydroxy-6-metoxy-1,4-benzoquinol methylase
MHSVLRNVLQTRDPNFVGFPKYRQNGAYHWKTITQDTDYREKVELVRTHVRDNSECLDLGCGDGAYMGVLARYCRRVVGIDADFDAVRLANRQFDARGIRNCTALQSAIGKIDRLSEIAGRKFDLVYSMDVLEHLPDAEELVRVAAAHCRPGGTVIIGTPIFLCDELMSSHHVKEFSIAELDALMEKHLQDRTRHLLPSFRRDGCMHPQSFYVAAGTPTDVFPV